MPLYYPPKASSYILSPATEYKHQPLAHCTRMARALVSSSCGLVDISTSSTRFSAVKFESPNLANCSDALIYQSRKFEKHQWRRRHRKRTRVPWSPSVWMVSNGYFGREKNRMKDNFNRIYKRVGSCLVIPPPKGKKPKAILLFLGGAFIGAVPEVSYSYLLGLLANEGYFIISVPYNVTFDHPQAAREIYERFHACFDVIITFGLPDAGLTAVEVGDLPLYSVGHSNGAHLQVLTGSYFSEKIPKANAIISYNNRPATEAVPYFEQLGPQVSQMMPVVEASPMSSMARSASGCSRNIRVQANALRESRLF